MIYLYAFLFSGFVCMIGQIVLDNTKLTAGHITTALTILGAFLSFAGVYPWLVEHIGGGATVLIMNFGHLLYQGAISGFKSAGLIGIFSGMLTKSSIAITSAIIFSFILSLFFNPKD